MKILYMNAPAHPDLEKPEQEGSFEECLDLLFEELSFAIQWQRPSILLAVYQSETVRAAAENALQERLGGIGQKLVQFKVGEKRYDIPRLLSRRPELACSVFSVTRLSRGGGREGANAYRALNMRREYFVDHGIRVVVWLSQSEVVDLSRHAPDFWAFRHRVVEFHSVDKTQG
jgi:hypothetical protein